MKKLALAALAATTLFTSPASATDHAAYVGIEGGLLFVRDQGIDLAYDNSSTSGGPILLGAATPLATETFPSFFTVDTKTGRDLAMVAGYDFGLVRAELELANKRANHDGYNFVFADLFTGNGGLPAEGSTRVNSAMVNVLLDAPVGHGISLYAGPGIGIAAAKMKMRFGYDADLGDLSELNSTIKDSSIAYQGIVGVRFAVTPQIELGAKYRYFEAPRIRDSYGISDTPFCDTTCELRTGFRSHSVLATLTYNFAAPIPVPAPEQVPAPVPAPEPAPATQTCYDGSVVLATDTCPMPPAPPAPEPAPERG